MSTPVFQPKQRAYESSERLRVLLDLSLALYRCVDLHCLMRDTLPKVRQILNVEAVSIMIADTPENFLQVVWNENLPEALDDFLKKTRIPMERSIAGSVFKSRCGEVIADVRQDSRHYAYLDQTLGFQTRSLLAIPLVSEDHAVGVLECINKTDGAFEPADVELGEAVAGILCLAIQRATLFEDLKKRNVQLQNLVDSCNRKILEIESEKERLSRELQGRHQFQSIIGSSEAMLRVFEHARHALNSDITVLIQGETGTGKELIARCLHYEGLRRDGPFVAENCATIPENLFASELFGHVKGAFSGAVRDRKGLLETAHNGTLFLDEVADMPMDVQKSLLRTLEDGSFRPVGSNETRRSDFRLITATHKDLQKEVDEGRFRQDLYYRISVFRIDMPPFRERYGDVPLLALHFLKEFDQKYCKNISSIDTEALELLNSYPFPGNVRELRNEIEGAYAVADAGRPLMKKHFSPKLLAFAKTTTQKRSQKLKECLETVECNLILEALQSSKGNQTQAAAMLGLSRYGLAKKIRRYKLSFEKGKHR
ncbi:MAG: sigma 54-interacting transcriptional regulator [Desulfosoma sp.]